MQDEAGLGLTLTNLINLLAADQAPSSVCPYFCGANLLASHKKSGGHRPIAIGHVLCQSVWLPYSLLLSCPLSACGGGQVGIVRPSNMRVHSSSL